MQALGISQTVRPQLRIEAPVKTVVQDTSTTNNTDVPPWVVFVLVLGWIMPTPNQIGRSFLGLFKRKT